MKDEDILLTVSKSQSKSCRIKNLNLTEYETSTTLSQLNTSTAPPLKQEGFTRALLDLSFCITSDNFKVYRF